MRCPKCRSEVGNQPVCPYCGGTIYLGNATWDLDEYSRRTTPVYQDIRHGGRMPVDTIGMERKLQSLELRINLLMVLQGGSFMLLLLMLILLVVM